MHPMFDFFKKNLKTSQKKRENFEEMIQGDGANLDPEEQHLFGNILKLRGECARDIMVPRSEIIGLQKTKSFSDINEIVVNAPFTRFPVYGETLDQVEGYIQGKHLCKFLKDPAQFSLKKIMRKLLFISPSMGLIDLLLQMRATKSPLAIVIDEHGGTDGLVTVWDVVSEIIGDLADIHTNIEHPKMTQVSPGQYLADGKYLLKNAAKEFDLNFVNIEEEELETIGGLVMYLTGRVPARREIIHHSSGFSFEVLDADSRRVKQVRIWFNKKPDETN